MKVINFMDAPAETASILKKSFDHKALAVIMAVIAVILGLAIYFYISGNETKVPEIPVVNNSNPAAKPAGLGASLYAKSQNPIQGALPQTTAPVPNPLGNAYKNPFK